VLLVVGWVLVHGGVGEALLSGKDALRVLLSSEAGEQMTTEDIKQISERYERRIQDLQETHQEAIAALKKPLYGFIYQMIQTRDDADDIYQETWLKVIRNIHRFRGGNFRAWLFRIAHNVVIDRARRRQHMPDLHSDRDPVPQLEDHRPPPDRQLAESETARRIRAAIDSLPELQKEVFLLRTEAGLSFREIAAVQKIPLNTALGRMHYAVRRLRRELADLYGEPERNQP